MALSGVRALAGAGVRPRDGHAGSSAPSRPGRAIASRHVVIVVPAWSASGSWVSRPISCTLSHPTFQSLAVMEGVAPEVREL